LGFLTDLDHLARRHRRRWRPIKGFRDRIYRLADALADHELPEIIARSLAKCQIVIDHAANHCEWLRTHGVPQAKYLPVPVLDRVGPTWRTERDDALATNKCQKVSLIGNVTGAATLPGLYLLAREIIPELKKRREWGRTEVHIIGGGKLPADLLSAFNHPWIKIRGYVDDIRAEFQSSDVFLVPTPIELGFRTRIAEAFSFGACVVAHKANSAGMPELSDGKNALLSESGSGLAGAIVRCLQEPQLRRRLEDAGRETFEQSLDGTKVCNGMIDLLEEAVRTHAE
jgi:glycosyltransferase involved in cell wall biosynthesis